MEREVAMESHAKHANRPHPGGAAHYRRLAWMMALSFVAMYVLMYAMVDRFEYAYHSINQAWMAGLMTAPMLVIELLVMGAMYPDRKLNAALLATGVLVGVACWFGIRQQVAVDDRQFLRSMIPHHAGALLMCRQNRLRDPELQALCGRILASQQAEIDFMTARLEGR
jgi:hypothetical protein